MTETGGWSRSAKKRISMVKTVHIVELKVRVYSPIKYSRKLWVFFICLFFLFFFRFNHKLSQPSRCNSHHTWIKIPGEPSPVCTRQLVPDAERQYSVEDTGVGKGGGAGRHKHRWPHVRLALQQEDTGVGREGRGSRSTQVTSRTTGTAAGGHRWASKGGQAWSVCSSRYKATYVPRAVRPSEVTPPVAAGNSGKNINRSVNRPPPPTGVVSPVCAQAGNRDLDLPILHNCLIACLLKAEQTIHFHRVFCLQFQFTNVVFPPVWFSKTH